LGLGGSELQHDGENHILRSFLSWSNTPLKHFERFPVSPRNVIEMIKEPE